MSGNVVAGSFFEESNDEQVVPKRAKYRQKDSSKSAKFWKTKPSLIGDDAVEEGGNQALDQDDEEDEDENDYVRDGFDEDEVWNDYFREGFDDDEDEDGFVRVRKSYWKKKDDSEDSDDDDNDEKEGGLRRRKRSRIQKMRQYGVNRKIQSKVKPYPSHQMGGYFRNVIMSTSSTTVTTTTKTTGKSRLLVTTETTELQAEIELECERSFINISTLTPSQLDHLLEVGLLLPGDIKKNDGDQQQETSMDIRLLYEKHAAYLHRVFETSTTPLPAPFVSLDASHPWMIYWCLHACDLLLNDDNNSNDDMLFNNNSNDHQKSRPESQPKSHKKLQLPRNLLQVVQYLEKCWKTTTIYFHPQQVQQNSILRAIHEDNNNNNNETGCDTTTNTTTTTMANTIRIDQIALTGGGFGGGPGQMPHCATSYAAVLSLCIIATTNTDDNAATAESSAAAWQLLEKIRLPLYTWMISLQQQQSNVDDNGFGGGGGGFAMHVDGEVDVRAVYIVLCCTKLLGLWSESSIAATMHNQSVLDFCASCQTYEGGFGSEPDSEAHSGYTYCAMASLQWLLQHEQQQQQQQAQRQQAQQQQAQQQQADTTSTSSVLSRIDFNSLRDWLARRQMSYEGGFSGRTNKLVDGCYTFWQGGSIAIMEHWLTLQQEQQELRNVPNTTTDSDLTKLIEEYDPWLLETAIPPTTVPIVSSSSKFTERPLLLMDRAMLQRYVLLCCQDVHGGLRDKPSKGRDFYHSCYTLSGLSVSQHAPASLSLLLQQEQQQQEQPSPGLKIEILDDGDDNDNTGGDDDDDDDNADPEKKTTTATNETYDCLFGYAIRSRVHATHPCYNIRLERVRQVLEHFHQRPLFPNKPTTA